MRSLNLGIVLAGLAVGWAGCGDDTGSADPTRGPGGPSGGGSSACGQFDACGGDVVGDWNIETICFENPEVILPITQQEPMCADALRDVEVHAEGMYSFGADGQASTDLVFSMDMDTLWTEACVLALTDGASVDFAQFCPELETQFASGDFPGASCELERGGCGCMLTSAEQTVTSTGGYSVADNELVLGSGGNPFCVEGDGLSISVTASGLTGTFLLQRLN